MEWLGLELTCLTMIHATHYILASEYHSLQPPPSSHCIPLPLYAWCCCAEKVSGSQPTFLLCPLHCRPKLALQLPGPFYLVSIRKTQVVTSCSHPKKNQGQGDDSDPLSWPQGFSGWVHLLANEACPNKVLQTGRLKTTEFVLSPSSGG